MDTTHSENGRNSENREANGAEQTLDVRRLLCPLPVIRLQQAIQNLSRAATLRVLATDPGVLYDIPAWCRIHGHTVLEVHKKEREIHLTIQANRTKEF